MLSNVKINFLRNRFFLTVSNMFFLLSFTCYSQEINWIGVNDLKEVIKTSEKNIIIDVYTNWCGPCKLMERNTFLMF